MVYKINIICFLKYFLGIQIYVFYFSYCNTPYFNRFDKEESVAFLKNFILPGELVFDVGANVGKKTELYLLCGARVVCFEPQANCIAELIKKFKNNQNVYIESIGLADKEGYLEFFQSNNADTISSFSKDWVEKGRFAERNYKWKKIDKIKVTTLDKMIQKYGFPSFCKIDVENFEFEVLKGLTVPIKYLSFEYNCEFADSSKKCLDYLMSLGYNNFNFAPGERGWFLFPYWLTGDVFFEELQKITIQNNWEEIWGLWGDIYAKYTS